MAAPFVPPDAPPNTPSSAALVIDDDDEVRTSLRLVLQREGIRVLGVATGSAALAFVARERFDLIFLDVHLAGEHGLALLPALRRHCPGAAIIVITGRATIPLAVEAIQRGADNFLAKPFDLEDVRRIVRATRDTQRARISGPDLTLSQGPRGVHGAGGIYASHNAVYLDVIRTALRVAPRDSAILVGGENGTGKNMLVRLIHEHSRRADHPLVSVNCPMLSKEHMMAEMFGHVRGSFTGAVADVKGKVQRADRGTLFLDEIGDSVDEVQVGLLRFTNEKVFSRFGDAAEQHADVRLISATNCDLAAAVRAGRFREDLYYRIKVVELTLPPLRDRPEDVLALAHAYLHTFASDAGRPELTLSVAAEQMILAHDWPGNLRQLHHAFESAVAVCDEACMRLGPEHFNLESAAARAALRPTAAGDDVPLDVLEFDHVARVIARSSSMEAAAQSLGIAARTLRRMRAAMGLQ